MEHATTIGHQKAEPKSHSSSRYTVSRKLYRCFQAYKVQSFWFPCVVPQRRACKWESPKWKLKLQSDVRNVLSRFEMRTKVQYLKDACCMSNRVTIHWTVKMGIEIVELCTQSQHYSIYWYHTLCSPCIDFPTVHVYLSRRRLSLDLVFLTLVRVSKRKCTSALTPYFPRNFHHSFTFPVAIAHHVWMNIVD